MTVESHQSSNAWTPRQAIPMTPMVGRFVRHVMLVPKLHGPALWKTLGETEINGFIRYMLWPQFENADHFVAHLNQLSKKEGKRSLLDRMLGRPVISNYFAIVDANDGAVLGLRGYVAPDLRHGVVETGAVIKGPGLSRTALSTESAYLAARRVFDECGFRRYECRCNNDNEAAKRAAMRIGFRFEGVFRNHRINNGMSYDTAWYSITWRNGLS